MTTITQNHAQETSYRPAHPTVTQNVLGSECYVTQTPESVPKRQMVETQHSGVPGVRRWRYQQTLEELNAKETSHSHVLIEYPNVVVGEDLLLYTGTDVFAESQENAKKPRNEKYMVDKCVQTLYREQETQTDPYSPNYVIADDEEMSEPEVLRLKRLGLEFKEGFPANEDYVELIEWSRKRKAIEDALPDPDDRERAQERLEMLKQLEEIDWQHRSDEINRDFERKQAATLDSLSTDFRQRGEKLSEYVAHRAEEAISQREHELSLMKQKRLRAMRKLTEQKANIEERFLRRDIIEEYADYGSRVYAPIDREGKRENIHHQQLLSKLSPLPSDLPLPKSNVGSVKTMTENKHVSGRTIRKQEAYQRALLRHTENHSLTRTENVEETPSIFAKKIEKPPPRPLTPSLEFISDEEDNRFQALLLLQRLLRGRAVQNEMYEGVTRRRDLIRELTKDQQSEMNKEEEQNEEEDLFASIPKQEDDITLLYEGVVHGQVAQVVGDTLDFLASHLVRMRDHQQILALAQTAEKERKEREAKELLLRQQALERQKDTDRLFREVSIINRSTIETYLSTIVDSSIQQASTLQALRAEQNEPEFPTDDIDTAVLMMMEDYLYPAVRKEAKHREVMTENQKFSKAATDVLNYVLSRN